MPLRYVVWPFLSYVMTVTIYPSSRSRVVAIHPRTVCDSAQDDIAYANRHSCETHLRVPGLLSESPEGTLRQGKPPIRREPVSLVPVSRLVRHSDDSA